MAAFTDLERLLLERELHQVVCLYARLCDERDWAAVDRVFSPDASADYGGRPLKDREALRDMLRRHLGGCGPTQHLLGNLQVQIDGNGVSSRVSVRAAHRGAGTLQDQTYECLGEYRDRWVHTPQGWRIAHRSMVVTLEFGNRRVLRAVPG
jgi:3-phenylpropionate/cinnamic acid dioxygenase small subunit